MIGTTQTDMLSTVIATQVPDGRRPNFLPNHFGHAMLSVESETFDWMGKLCDSYTGGYWDFFELSNGGAYMVCRELTSDAAKVRIAWAASGYSGDMSAEAASITAMLFSLSHLSYRFDGRNPKLAECISEHFHKLRDFAAEHPEAGEIFAAID